LLAFLKECICGTNTVVRCIPEEQNSH
jgi:hypothetical protein